ncbi:MAG: NAD(+)/NADH kinase [Chloroflexota bacterium]
MPPTVSILYHPHRHQAATEANWLAGALLECGVQSSLGSAWDSDTVSHLCCDRDLVVVFGGDGTILRVALLGSPFGVPLLGINLGRVGFLAELTPEALRGHIARIVTGDYRIEARCMLEVEANIGDQRFRFQSLNEVAVARGVAPRAIHVHIRLDGDEFMTYTADGVLVATATGSTAYSLAAGGPILYPESQDFIITPVAPHLHIGRSMIVGGNTRVHLSLSSDRPAVLSIDGSEEHALRPGDEVEVFRSEMVARFARFSPHKYFYAAVANRLK